MRFAEKLDKLMELRGFSQTALGEAVGETQTTISATTRDKRRPYLDQGFAIARALGVSLDWMADESREDLPPFPVNDDETYILRTFRALRDEQGATANQVVLRMTGAPTYAPVAVRDSSAETLAAIAESRRPKRAGKPAAAAPPESQPSPSGPSSSKRGNRST